MPDGGVRAPMTGREADLHPDEQAVVVVGEHRHGAGPTTGDLNEHPARAGDDVGAANAAQLGTDEPRTGPEADER